MCCRVNQQHIFCIIAKSGSLFIIAVTSITVFAVKMYVFTRILIIVTLIITMTSGGASPDVQQQMQ